MFSQAALEQAARAKPKIAEMLAGKTVRKVFVAPKRMVNRGASPYPSSIPSPRSFNGRRVLRAFARLISRAVASAAMAATR